MDVTAPKTAGFSAERLARIGRFVEAEVAARRMPGAAVLIERRGTRVLDACWGYRDAAAGTPMSLDTIFRIYSMTKPIVSVAAMMLAEEGLLRLDQPVAEIIPSFGNLMVAVEDGNRLVAPRQAMTVQDLMRHTSGITYGIAGEGFVKARYRDSGLLKGRFTSEEFVDRLARLPLAYEPGRVWDYSHSTDVLGRVVEIVGGGRLSDVLRTRLFAPLGMRDTAFFVKDAAHHARIAEPFAGDTPFGPGTTLSEPRVEPAFESGGGGLVSTLDDYARFARMLLARGTLEGQCYLSPHSLRLMASDHIGPSTGIVKSADYIPGPGFGFGLGFAVRTEPGASAQPGSVGEFKWSGIAGTYFWIDPAEDMFAVILCQAPMQRQRLRTILKALVYGALVE